MIMPELYWCVKGLRLSLTICGDCVGMTGLRKDTEIKDVFYR